MKKILVVDDQPDNVFLLKDRLEHAGFAVITAYEGETGIKKALEETPDLILLDIMMPGMSGLEVCRSLAENPKSKEIPVILVTALNNPEDIKEGFQSGAFDYVTKPFNKIELLARINSALRFIEAKRMLIELEKVNIFEATVITANHEIKQPLTLINLSVTAMKRELEKAELSREVLAKKIYFIENAARDITNVLDKFNSIKTPNFTTYLNSAQMISLLGDEE